MTKFLSPIPRYALFTLLVFASLARGAVHAWSASILHLLTLIGLTAFLLERSLGGDWKWIPTPLDKPMLLLVVLCAVSTLFSLHLYTSFWSGVMLLNLIVAFYLIIHVFSTRVRLRRLIYVIIGVSLFLSLFGFLKVSGRSPFFWWQYPEIVHNIHRLSATYGNANHLAGYMEMAIPLTIGVLLSGVSGGHRVFLIGALICSCLALMLSLSRGGWLGTFGGLLFMALVWTPVQPLKKKQLVFGCIAVTLVGALFVLSSTPTVERILAIEKKEGLAARTRVWSGAVDMIRDYPLSGTGPGTFSFMYTRYQPPGFDRRYFHAHNDYIEFVSELGLFLIPVGIWMVIVFYRAGFRKLKNTSRLVRGTTAGAMAGVTAILIHGIYDFNLHIPANALLFTTLSAIVLAPLPKDGHRGRR